MNKRFRIKDKEAFLNKVFGAECLLKFYPQLMTFGIELIKVDDFYYITENGKINSDTAFFSEKEMAYLEEIKTPGLLSFKDLMDTFDDDFKQKVEVEFERIMKVKREPKI